MKRSPIILINIPIILIASSTNLAVIGMELSNYKMDF